MLKTTYESLLKTNPKTVEKMLSRAKEIQNPYFDGSSDPSTWEWTVDFTSKEPPKTLYGILSTQNLPNDDKLLLKERENDEKIIKDGIGSFLKSQLEKKELISIIRLDVGVSKFNEYTSIKEEVPEVIVENYKLKTHPAIETDKPLLKVYKPNTPDSPGINQLEVEAAFYRKDGGYTLILLKEESDISPDRNVYDIVHLDKDKNTAIFAATVIGDNTGWNIKEQDIWIEMSHEQEWWRVPLEDIKDELNQVWGYYLDIGTFNKNRQGYLLDALFPKEYFPVKSTPFFDNEESSVVNSKIWGVGEKYSDLEYLSKKWEMYDELVFKKEKEANSQVEIINNEGNVVEVQKPKTLNDAINLKDDKTFLEILNKYKEDDNIEWLEDQEDKPVVSYMLQLAAEKGTPLMIKELIELGANPYYIHREMYGEGQFSFTSLGSATLKGDNVETLNFLLEQDLVSIEQTNNCEYTLFMESVLNNAFKVSNRLLELGANIEATNLQGSTVLHIAAQGNNPNLEAIQYLVEKRINPDIENFQSAIASELIGDKWDDLYQLLEDYAKAYSRGNPYEISDENINNLKQQTPLIFTQSPQGEKDELTEALNNSSLGKKMEF